MKKIIVVLRKVDFREDEKTPSLCEWQGWEVGQEIEAELTSRGDVLAIATQDTEHCAKGDYTALHECEYKIKG